VAAVIILAALIIAEPVLLPAQAAFERLGLTRGSLLAGAGRDGAALRRSLEQWIAQFQIEKTPSINR
jgi:hypothetical protein